MLFKSILREKPYHSLYVTQVLHGCLEFVPRGVRLIPLTNETPPVSYTYFHFNINYTINQLQKLFPQTNLVA